MRTGSRAGRGRGFTYLWLMFLLAIGAALLAEAGTWWSTAARRDRELELMFRGQQIAAAIGAFHAGSSGALVQWPRSLEDLLDDRRGPTPRHHLRRAWTDPFTGRADWEPVVDDEDGGWRGVHSRSQAPSLFVPATEPLASARRWKVSDHRFMAPVRAVAAPDESASAAPSAGPVASAPFTASPASDPPRPFTAAGSQ